MLDWNPPELRLQTHEEGGSISKKLREPSFYDRHLTNELILKNLQYHPDLAAQIAGTVDKAIQTALADGGTLPPPDTKLMDDKGRKNHLDGVDVVVSGELPITSFYKEATAHLCLPIASTLVFHPKHDIWATILQWSITPNARVFAIADGTLRLLNLDPKPTFRDEIHASMGPHMVETVCKLQETYPDLAVWEMKSLTVGRAEVMLGIKRLASAGHPFKWDECTCDGSFHPIDRMDAVDNTRAGPDAPDTPWKIMDVYEDFTDSSVAEVSEDEKIGAPVGDDCPIMASPPPTADLTGPSTWTGRSETEKPSVVPKDKGKQREDNPGPSRAPAKRKRDGLYKEPATLTAEKFIQQVSNAGKPQDTRR